MTEVLPETHQLRVELEKRQLEKTDLQQHRDDNTKIEDTESVSTSADKKSKFVDGYQSYTYTLPSFEDLEPCKPLETMPSFLVPGFVDEPGLRPLTFNNPSPSYMSSYEKPQRADFQSRLSKEQGDLLEALFQQQARPNSSTKRNIAHVLGLPVEKINNWFQNRPAKVKMVRRDDPRAMLVDPFHHDGDSLFYIDRINDITSQHVPHITPLEKSQFSPISTADWSYIRSKNDLMQRRREKYGSECPSLTSGSTATSPSLASGSTVTSRNSSTRSARWYGNEDFDYKDRCIVCDRVFEDLKAHMLTHQHGRPEKCPIKTCEYHGKGFARKYDQVRHTVTHFKGVIVCGFCPSSVSTATRTFGRTDVISRHLVSDHGAQALSTARRHELYITGTLKEHRKLPDGLPIAACSLCSEPFDPQGMYEHIHGCVLRQLLPDEASTSSSVILESPEETDKAPVEGRRNDSVIIAIKACSTETPNDLGHSNDESRALQSGSVTFEQSPTTSEAMKPSRSVLTNKNTFLRSSEPSSTEIEELTVSSRCLSLTSSNGIKSSDEETDWTEDAGSPHSDTDAVTFLSPVKRQLVDEVMKEFHRLFDSSSSRLPGDCTKAHTCGNLSNDRTSSSSGSSLSNVDCSRGASSCVSRKRSLSGGGSRPPNDDNGEDPNKRRRPEPKFMGNDAFPEQRFACPYYKRNPGRHQTFTSCRDPGFITVARLKEHLYRRHLLPIQCNRCCSTFANEPSLREHQRDLQVCQVREQIPLEGFDKDQERKLKSKKRSMAHQSEEEKWKAVYRILFPDDNDTDMPSPYIEYQAAGTSPNASHVARFQEFSRLELPRLVRRTLEVVVEEEAQPLEERLKDKLVDIVKECQTQLISMFQSAGGILDDEEESAYVEPPPAVHSDEGAVMAAPPFEGFESFAAPTTAAPMMATTQRRVGEELCYVGAQKPGSPPVEGQAHTPDSGYDSTWTAAGFSNEFPISFDTSFYGENEYVDIGAYYPILENSHVPDVGPSTPWPSF